MKNNFTEETYDAVRDAAHFDFDDVLAFGANYFRCGWKEEKYYNPNEKISLFGNV